MVRVDEAVIARIKKEGKTFEVMVDCDKAIEFREGKIESLEDVLATKEIFSDVKQSERATDIDIKYMPSIPNKVDINMNIINCLPKIEFDKTCAFIFSSETTSILSKLFFLITLTINSLFSSVA